MNLQILLGSRDNLPGDNIRRAMEDSSQNQAKLDCARDNLNKEKSFPNYKANSALSFLFFTHFYGPLLLTMNAHWNRAENNCCFM